MSSAKRYNELRSLFKRADYATDLARVEQIMADVITTADQMSKKYPAMLDNYGKKYCKEIMERLVKDYGFVMVGKGGNRAVFNIGSEDVVLKVLIEITTLSIQQNQGDLLVGQSSKYTDIFPASYGGDPGGLWMLQEKVIPLTSESEIGDYFYSDRLGRINNSDDWEVVMAALEYIITPQFWNEPDQWKIGGVMEYMSKKFSDKKKGWYTMDKIVESLMKNSHFVKWISAIKEFGLGVGDLWLDNLGWNSNDNLVILDSGMGLKRTVGAL